MSEEILVLLVSRLPDFFFTTAAVVILLTLLGIGCFMVARAKRIADSTNIVQQILDLQERLAEAQESSRFHEAKYRQASTAFANLRFTIQEVNRLKGYAAQDLDALIAETVRITEKILESIVSDVKHLSGERHRCGLWLQEGNELVLSRSSANFPTSYRNPPRRLSLERSLAGKAFRRGEAILLNDVAHSDDWEPHPDSTSPYTAIICVPVNLLGEPWGVITLDALKPMSEDDLLIVQTYGELMEAVTQELVLATGDEPEPGPVETVQTRS